MERECPFCVINPTHTEVLEDHALYFVALSNPRLIPGHTLVIPKRHVERLDDLEAVERVALFDTAIRYQEKIVAKYTPGCDLRQNLRPFLAESSTKVNHVHLHLLPRDFEDEYYQIAQRDENLLWQEVSLEEKSLFRNIYGSP